MKARCIISDYTCPYHACMTDNCRKEHVIESGADWGPGNCEKMTYMIENSGKSFNQAYAEWLFSPDGFRKSEPRHKFCHLLNRLEGIARRRETKLPRRLKKKLRKNANRRIAE